MTALRTLTVLGMGMVLAMPALTHAEDRLCSIQTIVGSWVFATEVSQSPGGNITAIGTANIDREGNISGKFDFTVAVVGFFPDTPYTGFVTVNPDCTGTVTFTTTFGSRTDSLAVVGPNETWTMSRDPQILWTARSRRISGSGR